MKNVIMLSLLFCLGISSANAQTYVGGININENETVYYCQLVSESRIFSKTVDVTVDWGQEITIKNAAKQKISDENGKVHQFYSFVGAFNYMEANGWEYIESHAITMKNGNEVYHYLFRKKDRK